MATDTLDPGPLGDYPHLPRNPDGTLDTKRMPVTPLRATDQPQVRHLIRRLDHLKGWGVTPSPVRGAEPPER